MTNYNGKSVLKSSGAQRTQRAHASEREGCGFSWLQRIAGAADLWSTLPSPFTSIFAMTCKLVGGAAGREERERNYLVQCFLRVDQSERQKFADFFCWNLHHRHEFMKM
jgi:hypothetical protein